MVGALALLVCLAGAGGVGWILYFLYAPKLATRLGVPRVPGHLVLEPMFAARRAPVPPRARMARGTGAVVMTQSARDERTDKVEALPLH